MTWILLAAVSGATLDGGLESSPTDAGVASPAAVAPAPAWQPAPADAGTAAPAQSQPQIVYVPVPQPPEREPEERYRHFFVNLEAGGGRIDLSSVAEDGTVVVSRTVGFYGGLNVGVRFLRFLAVVLEGRLGH